MPIYSYEAKTKHGNMKKGKIEAADKNAVIASLMEMSFYPVSIKQEGGLNANVDFSMLQKVSIRDISIFCRQFAYTVLSGITILRALGILSQQTEQPKLKSILSQVYDEVQKGESLSASMGKHKDFPDMLINMIAVGEASGNIDDIMLRMAEYYDKEYKQQQKVKQALTYPIIVCIFAVLIVNVLVIKVLPTFIQMIKDGSTGQVELPLPTRVVIAFSDFMRGYWFVILGVVLAIFIVSRLSLMKRKSSSWDKFKLIIPVIGKINSKIVTSKFARTFGILISSGLPLIQSMEICAEVVGNVYIKNVLHEAGEEIQKGVTLGYVLEQRKIFPPMLTSMIRIGEESGTLEDVLKKTAEFYDGEVEAATAQLTTMLEPAIIIVLATVVGFIILSIILPMFQMYNTMGQ
ncbi:MAG: type II secretion system F family protein [Bacillota bacterium]|nr:type II secretion system F family protein [Bacillota bacterium]